MTQMPPAAVSPAEPSKPMKLQVIAYMCLGDGIFSVVYAMVVISTVVLSALGVTVGSGCMLAPCAAMGLCFAVVGIYPLVLGVLEILFATKLLPARVQVTKPLQWLAIMQIVNIISLDVVSVVVGILSLVFYSDPEVKAYFAKLQPKEGPAA